jgi:peptidoglycan/LPS O-acetylase OafA/YrhL
VLFARRRAAFSEVRGAALAIGAAAVLFLILVTGLIPYAFLQLGALLPVFLALIGGLASPSVVARAFSWRPIWTLGRASYATYILHVPLFFLMARFDRAMWTASGLNLLLYAVLLVAASLGGHRWIEEPCRRWLVRKDGAA